MVANYIENWIEWMNIDKIYHIIKNRKIFIWGSNEKCQSVSEFLGKNGVYIEGYLSDMKHDNLEVKKILEDYEELLYAKKLYFFITSSGYREDILTILNTYNYRPNDDYFYIWHKYTIKSSRGYFKDIYGNEIIGNFDNVTINLSGYGSKLYIVNNCTFGENFKIDMGYGSHISIGDGCKGKENFNILMKKKANLDIGKRCVFYENIRISSATDIKIGEGTTFGKEIYILGEGNAPILIGEDCMFSSYIKIFSDNGHSIFDEILKKNIYMDKEKFIILGNHVWIGAGVTILNNTEIGDNCIVGAESLIKGNYQSNQMIVGNPARVIKDNINWSRIRNLKYEDWEGVE